MASLRETIASEEFRHAAELFQSMPGIDLAQLASEKRWHEVPSHGYCVQIQGYPGRSEGVIDIMAYGVNANTSLPLLRYEDYGSGSGCLEVRLMSALTNTLLITAQPPTNVWDGVSSYVMQTTNFFFVDEKRAQLTPLGDGLQCVTGGPYKFGIFDKLLRLRSDPSQTGLYSTVRAVATYDEALALLEAAGRALSLTDEQYTAFAACMEAQLGALEHHPLRTQQALGDIAAS